MTLPKDPNFIELALVTLQDQPSDVSVNSLLEYDFCWKNSKAEPKPNDSIALAE
jgi:hypothetical protein